MEVSSEARDVPDCPIMPGWIREDEPEPFDAETLNMGSDCSCRGNNKFPTLLEPKSTRHSSLTCQGLPHFDMSILCSGDLPTTSTHPTHFSRTWVLHNQILRDKSARVEAKRLPLEASLTL